MSKETLQQVLEMLESGRPFLAVEFIKHTINQPEQPESGYTTTRNAWSGRPTYQCKACAEEFATEHSWKFHECKPVKA